MLKTTTVDANDITCVFSCDDCKKETKDSVSNIAYDGAPICCGSVMELSHAIVDLP